MDFSSAQKEYTSQEIKNLALCSAKLENKVFTACAFHKCSFKETLFINNRFQDCTFHNCDLSLAVLQECTFLNTSFTDSQLIGINWMNTNLKQLKFQLAKPVNFDKCALNHSTFMGLNLKNVKLSRCVAHDVSFEEADLSHADCRWTDFSDSRFMHTNLTEADFTGAFHYAIAAGFNTLKKTKFSLPEAMSLLSGLDIILTEDTSQAD